MKTLLKNLDATAEEMLTCKKCGREYPLIANRCQKCKTEYQREWFAKRKAKESDTHA